MLGRLAARVVQAAERRLWSRCSRIWVNSENLRRILTDNGVEAARVQTIPFGVVLNPNASALRSERADVEIIFVGSFYRWHGADVLLRAFASALQATGNIRLTLVGDGSERAPCEELARGLSLSTVVTFTGRLPHEEVLGLLARADIGVAPYAPIDRFYFDPAKILEYQASGLAIVASDQGRVSEMLEGGRGGVLVPPGDERALREALIRLVRDPVLRRRLGAHALQHAGQRGWDRVGPQIRELLESAVADGAPRLRADERPQ
jgi:glycosyltransferase involved in cell wall biosynthesis